MAFFFRRSGDAARKSRMSETACTPSLEEFLGLAKQGNVIPVYREVLADLETPVSAFLKIQEGDYSFLLESVEKGENFGRYSYLGCDPDVIFKCKGKEVQILYRDLLL